MRMSPKPSSTDSGMSMPMETREIGTVKEIDVEQLRFIYHRSGNPAEEALMLKELMDKGMSQRDVAKLLGVNHAHVSRRLKLLTLSDALFQRVLKGEIKARTGYQLARLPKEKQAEFEGVEKVTMKLSEAAVREFVLNEDVVKLIKSGEFEVEGEFVDAKFPAKLTPEERLREFVARLSTEELLILRGILDERTA